MKQLNSKSDAEILAHHLQCLRKRHGLSKQKTAACMGIGVRSLNKPEAGIIPPGLNVSVFYALYKRFHISPTEILSHFLDA